MITQLRKGVHEDLQLAGLAEGTQKAYCRAVKRFAAHFNKAPDQISEQEFREYLLYLKNQRHYLPGALTGPMTSTTCRRVLTHSGPMVRDSSPSPTAGSRSPASSPGSGAQSA